jgi:MFS family permease
VRRVFLAGQVTSLLGDGLALLAVPLLVLQLTHSPLAAGLASAMRSVGYLVVGVLAGPVVDRATAWRLLIAADAVRAAAFTALGVLAYLRVPQIGLILGIAFAAACATVFFDAALAVTVQDLFPRDRLVAANSAIETSSQMARIIGPVAAALLATAARNSFPARCSGGSPQRPGPCSCRPHRSAASSPRLPPRRLAATRARCSWRQDASWRFQSA